MAVPSVPNTLSNGVTSDATEVNQNFTALINSLTDGTKDLTVNQVNVSAVSAAVANLTINAYTRSTGTTVAVRGVAFSSSSGTFATNENATPEDVTNLSVTITTSGRPVVIALKGNGSNEAYVGVSSGTLDEAKGWIYIIRDSTTIGYIQMQTEAESSSSTSTVVNLIPPGAVFTVDAVSAGTYTYKIQTLTDSSSDIMYFNNCILVAYEL